MFTRGVDIKAYRIATNKEKAEREVSWDYDLLIGPNDFECWLGEPEDCTWSRDGEPVVNELNRLHNEVQRLSLSR